MLAKDMIQFILSQVPADPQLDKNLKFGARHPLHVAFQVGSPSIVLRVRRWMLQSNVTETDLAGRHGPSGWTEWTPRKGRGNQNRHAPKRGGPGINRMIMNDLKSGTSKKSRINTWRFQCF